jgi:transcriptional regulator with XRE-family HTH domain
LESKSKNSPPSVSQRIKAARKAKGLTLTQVGELIGVTNQALSAIETGKVRPSKQTLKSLSRVLNDYFGLASLVELRTPRFKERDEGYKPLYSLPDFEEQMHIEAMEAYEASKLPKPVRRTKLPIVYVPIHYEILNGCRLNPYSGEDYVVAPAQMVPVLKHARAVRMLGEPMREAFAEHGDVIVVTECPNSVEDKIVLVEVDDRVFLRRWIRNGRKVTLSAPDQKHESLELSPKRIKCIGEVTGMLKSTRPSPVPILICGSWPFELFR